MKSVTDTYKTKEIYYFLGIGGIGMSALARYFAAKGFRVAGYDKTRTKLTDTLEAEGIEVIYADDPKLVSKEYLEVDNCELVFTPAIPQDLELLKLFKELGFAPRKRAEILGVISRNNDCLAVAGTHGKTTTTALLTHLLYEGGIHCSAFIGGIANNFKSNYVIGDADAMVVEADEFDRSFLHLEPTHAVINSMDADHLDIYGTAENLKEGFRKFKDQVKGQTVVKKGLDIESDFTYSLQENADFHITEFSITDGKSNFRLHFPKGESVAVDYTYPGFHNVENALAASSLAYLYGMSPNQIAKGLTSFCGVQRRFDRWKFENRIYIDDYAHHPAEIEVLLQSVKEYYPGKKVMAIFQPHLFTRTRDFMDEFAKSLSLADEIVLMDIYPARELPISGIHSGVLRDRIQGKEAVLLSGDQLLERISKTDSEVIVTIGAGDIDRMVEKIKTVLKSRA